ncbi:MAG TPA: allantoinase AllB [Thermomicrobiales bacterium]|nr:allantoinase AllB [Thermomicrobiales bacterium]
MPVFDVLVRNGHVVTEQGDDMADIGISDGRIAEIGPELAGSAAEEIDLAGATVFPGVVDAHVHVNEPGRTEWEGWASGSAAMAAGGTTTCVEMPLNAIPPTLDGAAFDAKVAALARSSIVDVALWGGLTPANLDRLEELADRGVVGFKAFLSRSGTSEFRHADDDTLFLGMQRAAALDLPVAVHAENDAITAGRAARAVAAGSCTMRDYLESRPVVAELEAIGRAVLLAEAAGCRLHIVHVSSGAGVALIVAARERGVDVTCETCPHYLLFTDEDVERIGALAKCAPPIRDARERETLWEAVRNGDVDWIASDHSPAPPSMKRGEDAFAIWGGISGCQHLLATALTGSHTHHVGASIVARLLATAPAERLRLAGKGAIAVGNDADLTWGTRQDPAPLPVEEVRYRHPRSAWDEVPLTWRAGGTMLRGTVIARDGRVIAEGGGRLVRPEIRSTA